MNLAELTVKFETKFNDVNESLRDMDKQNKQTTKSSKETEEQNKKTGGSFLNLGNIVKGIIGFFVIDRIVSWGKAFWDASVNLNKGMANVATLIPGSTQRVEELKTSVQGLSILTGKLTDDLSNGLYQVISAFGDTADTAKILEINAKSAAGGLAETTDAINLTSAVTKGYGDTSAEAVQHASDLALQTVKLGQTTFPELAGSIGRVTPLAASLNVSMDELFAVMATGSGVTGNAAEVSTQFRGVLQTFLAPTDSMTKLLSQMGFASGEAMIKQMGLQSAINAVVERANATNTPLADFIGSIEGQTLAMALAGEQSGTFTEKLKAMANVAGVTDAAFKEQTTGINAAGFAWEQLMRRFDVAAQVIGDFIGVGVKAVVEGITWLVDNLQKAWPVIEVLAKVIGTTLATWAIGALVVALPGLIAAIPGLIAGFVGWATTAGAAAVATIAATAPIIGIGLAVVAAIATVIALIQSWKEIWNAAKIVWGAINDVISSYAGNWVKLFGGLGKVILGALTFDKKMIRAGMEDAKNAFVDFATTAIDAGSKALNAIGGAGSAIWNNLKKDATAAANFITGASKKTNEEIKKDSDKTTEETQKNNKEQEQSHKELNEKQLAFLADIRQKTQDAAADAAKTNTDSLQAKLAALDLKKAETLKQANELGVGGMEVVELYALKKEALIKENNDEIAKLNRESAKNLLEQDINTLDQTAGDEKKSWSERIQAVRKSGELKLQLLAIQQQDEIAEAQKTGGDIQKIKEKYAKLEIKTAKDTADAEEGIEKVSAQFMMDTTAGILGKLQNLNSMYYGNKNAELDNQYAAEKARIEASSLPEEEKKVKLEALDKDYEKKRKELARRKAQDDKVYAIFQAIIDTASSITKALASAPPPLNFILAGISGAMGAAQISLIQSQPLPALAGGGTIIDEGDVLVGEQGPEIMRMTRGASVIPLNHPAANVNNIGSDPENIDLLARKITVPIVAALLNSKRESKSSLNVGVLVADKQGLKQLERQLAIVRYEETGRKGEE